MRYLKLILLLFSLTLFNCAQQIKIIEASKSKFISGLPNGRSYVDYRVKIETKTNIQFKSILLDTKDVPNNLYLKNLSSGMSSTKINPEIAVGIYEFGFRVFNFNNFSKEEKVLFNYLLKGKEKKLIKIIFKNDKINTNR